MKAQDTSRSSFDVPILVLAFNRPDHLRHVLEAVRAVDPQSLYVAFDGPRRGNQEDQTLIDECVALVHQQAWSNKPKLLRREVNLGCGQAVSSALDWFFGQEAVGIILEDDIVPTPEFFPFCRELLMRFESDERVCAISGWNAWPDGIREKQSYRFSEFTPVWGWATWARSWRRYQFTLAPNVDRHLKGGDKSGFDTRRAVREFWTRAIRTVEGGRVDTWALQWSINQVARGDLCAVSNRNLVQNIGFGNAATHTVNAPRIELAPTDLDWPLEHSDVFWHTEADTWIYRHQHQVSRFRAQLSPLRLRVRSAISLFRAKLSDVRN